jgi:hypothetical protein
MDVAGFIVYSQWCPYLATPKPTMDSANAQAIGLNAVTSSGVNQHIYISSVSEAEQSELWLGGVSDSWARNRCGEQVADQSGILEPELGGR